MEGTGYWYGKIVVSQLHLYPKMKALVEVYNKVNIMLSISRILRHRGDRRKRVFVCVGG